MSGKSRYLIPPAPFFKFYLREATFTTDPKYGLTDRRQHLYCPFIAHSLSLMLGLWGMLFLPSTRTNKKDKKNWGPKFCSRPSQGTDKHYEPNARKQPHYIKYPFIILQLNHQVAMIWIFLEENDNLWIVATATAAANAP